MSFFGTLKSIGKATGIWNARIRPVGCSLGKVVYREAKRSAQIANLRRPRRELSDAVKAELAPYFPHLDLDKIRLRTKCRLPPNRFNTSGSIYAMTFGYTIYWRDEFDESNPREISKLAHEVMHVDQVRRNGGEAGFACAYGQGYVAGDGDVPDHISRPTAYHRNPMEAEAYRFEARFRTEQRR
jgi:hypothetical protein